jgi:hypothetical protein
MSIVIVITVIYLFISKILTILVPNMPNITAEFHTITMSVTVNLEAILHMKYEGNFIIYFHSKFHKPSSSVLFVTTTIPTVKGDLQGANFFHIQKNYLVRRCILL